MNNGLVFKIISLSPLSSQIDIGLNSVSALNRSSLIAWFITIDPVNPDTDL